VNQPAMKRGPSSSLFQERGHFHEVGPCAYNRRQRNEATRGAMILGLAIGFVCLFPTDP